MHNFKKIILTLLILVIGLGVNAATTQDAHEFFNSFVSASNNYSPALLDMYASNAKIIRQVVKPNGQLVNAYFKSSDYKNQMKISSKIAKVRHYKNYYSNVSVHKISSNSFRITAMRKPSASNYKLKTEMVVEKQENGKWLITEELMQTKEQIFLRYAK